MPVSGLFEPRDDAQERRLAAAARAEQRRQRAGLDLERHVVERDELAEPLADAGDLDAHAGASFGLRKVIAMRTRMAMTASTIEIE